MRLKIKEDYDILTFTGFTCLPIIVFQHDDGMGHRTFVTQGTFDVLKLVGFNEERKTA